jgi:hypothetical protein
MGWFKTERQNGRHRARCEIRAIETVRNSNVRTGNEAATWFCFGSVACVTGDPRELRRTHLPGKRGRRLEHQPTVSPRRAAIGTVITHKYFDPQSRAKKETRLLGGPFNRQQPDFKLFASPSGIPKIPLAPRPLKNI